MSTDDFEITKWDPAKDDRFYVNIKGLKIKVKGQAPDRLTWTPDQIQLVQEEGQ